MPLFTRSTGPALDPSLLNILALDTSTERLALALQAPGGPWTVLAEGGARASATLLPQVHGLIARAGLQLADLHAIAFGMGPGAFTGLRTACAVAQGLAFGLGKPVLPIDSLLIVAEDTRLRHFAAAHRLDIVVAMDARMNEVYAGRYLYRAGDHGSPGAWRTLQAAGLHAVPTVASCWSDAGVQAVAGSALEVFAGSIDWPPAAAQFPHESDRASALLSLAVQAARAGQGVDAERALPLYLRDKVAQTTQEREAARSAARLAARPVTP